MAWSYEPVKTDKDKVRLLIGDTDECDQLLQDEEINFFLDLECSILRAARSAAHQLASSFGRQADEKVGQISVSFSNRAKHFLDLAKQLQMRADAQSLDGIYAGGISISDKETRQEDGDRVEPRFSKDLHEEFRNEPRIIREK